VVGSVAGSRNSEKVRVLLTLDCDLIVIRLVQEFAEEYSAGL